MSRSQYFKPGDWNAICYECGAVRKFSELKRHWQGYYVCPEHWEPRHPQDFVRGQPDNMSVPYTQDEPADQFVFGCTILGIMGISGYGTAGCMKAGFKNQSMIDAYLNSPFVIDVETHSAIVGEAQVGKAIVGNTDG